MKEVPPNSICEGTYDENKYFIVLYIIYSYHVINDE